jgi:hypothetical protein
MTVEACHANRLAQATACYAQIKTARQLPAGACPLRMRGTVVSGGKSMRRSSWTSWLALWVVAMAAAPAAGQTTHGRATLYDGGQQ